MTRDFRRVAAPTIEHPRRLAALHATELLDSGADESFDRLTALAARLLGAPTALVSLVDADRQFFKSCIGLGEPWATRRESPLSHSFCQHVVLSAEPLIIEDARDDARLQDSPAIREMGVIAYAGVPLINNDGFVLGSFCVFDTVPHRWSADDVATLQDLAACVMTEIQLRTDMRERLRTEIALRENEARFRNIVEAASDIIFGTDAYGFFTYANPVAAKVMGYPRPRLIGMHFTELVRADAREETEKFYGKQFREKIETTYYEFPAVNSGGADVWIGQNVRLVLENGEVVGAQAVARDITARHEMDRMKDEFVSVVSHELRTPLTSLRGSLGLLASGRLSDDQMTRMLGIAVNDTDRLIRLINDFLDLERIKSGRIQLRVARVPLNDLVESAVQSVRPQAEQLGVTVQVSVTPAEVRVDPDRMVQVLVNLLSNALKFSPRGAEVQLTASRSGNLLRVVVKDHGRGIPADHHNAIFEPFHQVDASDSRERGGTGLGLPIVRSIVEQHGGSITLESVPGDGAAFTVTVPA